MIGETIGNFKIISRLGRGGMGEVWLAEQQSIGTKVAIKLLRPDVSEDTEHVTRFFNEARAVSRIQHAGIVKIFDVGHHAGRAYLIMEYLEGEPLSARIARGKLPIDELCEIGRQIASVLDATHTAGITHRDLKPDNIFIVRDRELPRGERVKVLDFGIAKLTGTLANVSPRTTGTLGTPAYMAPEQWGDASQVDWRADLYSLGCVAFEMACGRPPFIVTNIAEACAKHLHDPPPHATSLVPALPPSLDDLLGRLLSKQPAARPQSAGELVHVFEAIAAGKDAGIAATVSSSGGTGRDAVRDPSSSVPSAEASTAKRRSPIGAAMLTGALALAGTAGAVAYLAASKKSSPTSAHGSAAPPIAVAPIDASVAADAPQIALSPLDAAVEEPQPVDKPPSKPVDKTPSKPVDKTPSKPATEPEKEGTIDADAVARVLERSPRLQGCYLAEVAKDPMLGGKLIATVKLDTDGKVVESNAAGVSKVVASCIADALKHLKFPRPVGGPVTMNIPMSFEPPDKDAYDKGGTLSATSHVAGLPETSESLTATTIKPVLEAARSRLAACSTGWDGKGRVVITIAPDGSVKQAEATGAFKGTEEGTCVERVIEKLKFPKSQNGAKVGLPLDLKSR